MLCLKHQSEIQYILEIFFSFCTLVISLFFSLAIKMGVQYSKFKINLAPRTPLYLCHPQYKKRKGILGKELDLKYMVKYGLRIFIIVIYLEKKKKKGFAKINRICTKRVSAWGFFFLSENPTKKSPFLFVQTNFRLLKIQTSLQMWQEVFDFTFNLAETTVTANDSAVGLSTLRNIFTTEARLLERLLLLVDRSKISLWNFLYESKQGKKNWVRGWALLFVQLSQIRFMFLTTRLEELKFITSNKWIQGVNDKEK